MLLGFKKQFAAYVEEGSKTHTIRAPRAIRPKPGAEQCHSDPLAIHGEEMKTLLLSEAAIQQTCAEFMALDGWRALKTDPCSDKSRGKGFGETGMADHLFIRYSSTESRERGKARGFDLVDSEVLWVEFKKLDRHGRPTKPTQKQLDWHATERNRGALTVIAGVDFPATIEGFQAWYNGSGLKRAR